MQQDKTFLGTEPVGRLLFQLAVPTVTAQLVNMLYNIVDRIYIGHMPGDGSLALTGVGVCMPLIMIVSAFAALVASGGAPRASIAMGRGDDDAAGVAVDAVAQRGSEGVLPAGVPLPLLIEVRLDVVDECVHLLRLVSVDHQPRPLVDQQQVLVLVHDVHLRLEQRQEKILLRRLVKEFVVDV